MNKLFTKIATAFVGMAMAIGVGVAVANNRVMQTTKAADVEYEVIATFDFSESASASGTTSLTSDSANADGTLKTLLNDSVDGSNPVTSASISSGSVYDGKGTGGTGIPQEVLKIGTAKAGASFNFTIGGNDKVAKVDFTCYGWKTSSELSINSGTSQKPTDAATLWSPSFVLATATKTITVSVTSSSVCVSSFTLYKAVSSGPALPSVSVEGAAGPFYTSTEEIELTADPSDITPTSYTWAITSGSSYVTPGATNASTFTMTPVSAGTVEGTLTVTDGTNNASCNWSITIQAVTVTSVSWTDTALYWLTNTSFDRTEFGTVTVTYNDGSQTTPSITDSKMKVYAKVGSGEYAELSTKMFTAAGEYTCKVQYDGKDSTGKGGFKVVTNTGTIAEAKQYVSDYLSKNNDYFVGTFTTSVGVINTAANSSGHLYLGDTYNGDDDIYLYTCSDYGPVEGYEDLVKGASISASGKLMYYNKAELANYTVLTYKVYNGLSVKTPPTKVNYYVGDVFDPTGTVLTVAYSNSTTKDITSGYTYDLTNQLTTLGEQTVTFTFTENGISKTCTQTINVLPNPYTLTISQNALTMSEYSENTAITLTPSAGFGNDYVWEDVATTDGGVAVATIGENDLVTITSGEAGTATLTFEVYTSDLQHSASVALNVTVAAGSVTLSVNSVEVDVHGSSKTVDVTLANFESVPNITFSGNDSNYFTIAASNVTKTSATLTITAVAVKSATNVTVNVKTPDEYQSGSATLSVKVVDSATTISLSGTDFTDFNGQSQLVPTNWIHSGAEKFDTTKTVFKGATNYLRNDLLIPETNGDQIYAVIAQVFSVNNGSGTTKINTMQMDALKDGNVIEDDGASTTFQPYTSSVTNATAVENACTDANSKWALVRGTGMNGIKFSFKTKNSNWVVNEIKLFYLTKAEYDLAVALGDAAMESICTAGQSRTTPSDDLSSLWGTLKTNYSGLSTALSSYAYATSGTKATNHILDIALNRYNYICDKYNMDNFLQRTIVPTANHASIFNSIAESSNTVPVIIVVITLIGITTVGGYFFIRKRKHQ